MKTKIIIAVIGIVFSLILEYFHNKHKSEIKVLELQKDSLRFVIKQQDEIIKSDFAKIDSVKNKTDEKANNVSHYGSDSLKWFYSKGQYLNR